MSALNVAAFLCLYFSVAIVVGDDGSSTKFSLPLTNEHGPSINRSNGWMLEACADENYINSDDIRIAQSGVYKNIFLWPLSSVHTQGVKCTVSCVLRKRKVIVDGQLSMEGIILDAQNYFDFSETVKSAYLNATKLCYNRAQSVTDECELGYFFDECSSSEFPLIHLAPYENKKALTGNCSEKNNVTSVTDIFEKLSTEVPNVTYAEKCKLGCYYRELDLIVDGKLSLQFFNSFVEQHIYYSNNKMIGEKIIEHCPKRVERVTDECEMGFIIGKCILEQEKIIGEENNNDNDMLKLKECGEETNISDPYDTINRLKTNPLPATQAEKCMMGCLFRKENMIVNGTLSLEKWNLKVQNSFIKDQKKKRRLRNIYDTCTERVEWITDECLMGFAASKCIMENRRNYMIPFPSVPINKPKISSKTARSLRKTLNNKSV